MSLEPPAWIDKDYIRKCIQDGEETRQILVKSFDISPAVPPGNNYGSNIWRVKVKYQEKTAEDTQDLSLIVKAPLESGDIKELFDHCFQTEPVFYNELLPLLPDKSFAPRNFFSSVPGAIVMEDLGTQGYKMGDRVERLDLDQCRLYAKAAATFHAATVAAYKETPDLIESLGKEKLFSNEFGFSVGTKRISAVAVRCVADRMEGMVEFKKYTRLLRNCAETVWDDIVEIHKRSETFNSLVQGDPWTTNMMFRFDSSGKANGIKLLDFQALRYGKPVGDLVLFIWTSARHEVRMNHLEDLYRLYCDSLNARLQEFHCPERLPYDQLLTTIKSFFPLIVYITLYNVPLISTLEPLDYGALMKQANDVNVSDQRLAEIFSTFLTEAFCEKELPNSLKEMEAIGLFQYLESL